MNHSWKMEQRDINTVSTSIISNILYLYITGVERNFFLNVRQVVYWVVRSLPAEWKVCSQPHVCSFCTIFSVVGRIYEILKLSNTDNFMGRQHPNARMAS
jgi:hypothetical protein